MMHCGIALPLAQCIPASLPDHLAVLIADAPRFSCLVQSPYVSGSPRSSSIKIQGILLSLLLLIPTFVLFVICSPPRPSCCPLLMGIVGAATIRAQGYEFFSKGQKKLYQAASCPCALRTPPPENIPKQTGKKPEEQKGERL